jgi:hypothetical protein
VSKKTRQNKKARAEKAEVMQVIQMTRTLMDNPPALPDHFLSLSLTRKRMFLDSLGKVTQ